MNEFFALQVPTVEANGLIHLGKVFTNKTFCSLSKVMVFFIYFCKFFFILKNIIATFPVDKTNNCLFRFDLTSGLPNL